MTFPQTVAILRVLMLDLVRRGWVSLLLGFLGAFSLPVLMLSAFKARGILASNDPDMIIIHFIFAEILGMTFGAAVLHAAGPPGRLYSFPVSDRAIGLLQMVPGTFLVVGQTVLSGWVLNLLFDLPWPWLGQALCFSVIFATFQACLILFHQSLWMLPALVGSMTLEGLWLKSRHGPVFAQPNRYWETVTPLEILIMAMALALAYRIGIWGTNRQRHGLQWESSLYVYLANFFNALFGRRRTALDSPVRAQEWAEWYQKGWFLPIAVAMVLFITLVIWGFSSRSAGELVHTLLIQGWFFSVLCLITGLLMGNMGISDASMGINQFLATKPLKSTALCAILHKTAMKSILFAVIPWLFLLLLAIVCAPDHATHHPDVRFGWWYFPGVILSAWVAMSVPMCLALTGRSTTISVPLGLFSGWLIVMVIVSNTSPKWIADLFFVSVVILFGIALFAFTLTTWGVALKQGVMSARHAYFAAGFLCVGMALAGWHFSQGMPGGVHFFVLNLGLLSLTVFPFAGAPIALAWNRTR